MRLVFKSHGVGPRGVRRGKCTWWHLDRHVVRAAFGELVAYVHGLEIVVDGVHRVGVANVKDNEFVQVCIVLCISRIFLWC